jgi:hypothetical protein
MKVLFIEPFKNFLERVTGFLPSFLTGLTLIIAGLIIAWLLKTVIAKVSGLLKIDVLSEKIGIVQILQRTGIKDSLSGILGRVVYWIVLISFIIIGLDALNMPVVENLLERFLLYLPNVIVAGIVIFLGYLLGNFLCRAALIAAVNAGLTFARLFGNFVKFTVFFIAISMALELLGIGKNTVLIAFAIIFGGVVLALAIAFGHGGKKAAEDYINKRLKEKEKKDDIEHI